MVLDGVSHINVKRLDMLGNAGVNWQCRQNPSWEENLAGGGGGWEGAWHD